MSGEITRWLANTPAERDRNRALERIDLQADLTQARVQAVVGVAQTAVLGALTVGMTKREAALLLPEDAAKFDLIATSAAIAVAGEIDRLQRRLS